jgi:hypothetical protein
MKGIAHSIGIRFRFFCLFWAMTTILLISLFLRSFLRTDVVTISGNTGYIAIKSIDGRIIISGSGVVHLRDRWTWQTWIAGEIIDFSTPTSQSRGGLFWFESKGANATSSASELFPAPAMPSFWMRSVPLWIFIAPAIGLTWLAWRFTRFSNRRGFRIGPKR